MGPPKRNWLPKPLAFSQDKAKFRGNCYAAAEALYHLLGGKRAGWVPMNMHWEGESHWFLLKVGNTAGENLILDPTACQFQRIPDYNMARGRGFLTRKPSNRALQLMNDIVYARLF